MPLIDEDNQFPKQKRTYYQKACVTLMIEPHVHVHVVQYHISSELLLFGQDTLTMRDPICTRIPH